jgi:16S rRNA (adenine1518-N6/adenine1519-N6)-dimethyltransferase
VTSKPKLGQNFLIDPSACIAIAYALGDLSERTVVEIGPGAGAITEILSARARRLVAIELDRELAPRLRAQFADRPSVEVLEADILKVDLRTLRQKDEKLLIVGNLPYYITSDILLRLLEFHSVIERAVIMVQREVAARIAAVPGTRDYGLLSATVQLYARTEKILTLPPTAFMPPPEVHSTVVRLVMAPRWAELGISAPEDSQVKPKFAPPSEVREFIAFLRQSFAQKRKTLAKNLRAAGFNAAGIAESIQKAGVAPTARAEQLDLHAMAAVFKHLGMIPSPAHIQRLGEPG